MIVAPILYCTEITDMEKDPEIGRVSLSAKQNMIVAVLLVLFFVGIIIIYYVMLYSETRSNIINKGELDAVSSADRIDKYLSTGVNVITMTGYTLDSMMENESPQSDILDCLVNQTAGVAQILTGDSTGIYGFINGEYLDGSGWEPDADYVPTERPWYIEATAGGGNVVVVEPYLDAQTGNITITLAKTLRDGKSVVALDFSLVELQLLTEQLAADSASDMEIILDRDSRVIAHSDRNEINKHYMSEKGTLGHAIAEQLTMSHENFFEVSFSKERYFVYAQPVENDWMCLSVIDTTPIFSRMSLPLLLMILAAAFIIMILIALMVRSNSKSVLAEKMKEIADIQTHYAYYDEMTGLKNRRAYSEMLDRLEAEMPENCSVIMFDVNGLKTVNDTNGHEAGDELIIAAGECIRSAFDNAEDIFRLGGDEFCVILTNDSRDVVSCFRRLEKMAAGYKGKYINGLSISYGMGSAKGNSDIGSVLKEADRRMYEFKDRYYVASGKDRRHRSSDK